MIARLAWYGLLAVIAAGTAGLQLDRQAGSSPQLAAAVPEPFRSLAQARIVNSELRAAGGERALEEAERLVERRPVPAQSLRMLALAQYRAGQLEQGGLSIQLAARRGWRDVAAQEAMARFAIAAGDRPEAARRYGALLARAETPEARLAELGEAVFPRGEAASRETLAEIVAGSDRWRSLFLRRASQVMPPDAFADVLRLSIERGAEFDCAPLAQAVKTLDRRAAAEGVGVSIAVPDDCAR